MRIIIAASAVLGCVILVDVANAETASVQSAPSPAESTSGQASSEIVRLPTVVPANQKIYVESNGTLYPLQGFVIDSEHSGVIPPTGSPVLEEVAPAWTMMPAFDANIVEYRGHRNLNRIDLLPPAIEPNDLFHLQLDPSDTRLGGGWSAPASVTTFAWAEPAQDLWTRFKALPNFGVAYDTGFVTGAGFDVQKIELGESPAAGQSRFTGSEAFGEVPVMLLFDNQIRNLNLPGAEQVQFFMEANNHADEDELRLNHIYGRVWDRDRITIGAGKTHSLFSSGGVVPATVGQSTTLVGTGDLDDNKRAQLRIQLTSPKGGGWGGGFAIEDPYKGDFTVPTGGTPLTRWPSFAGNFLFVGANDVDRIQFSSLIRTLGFEASDRAEHFATAWGLSAYARIATVVEAEQLQGLFVGMSAGEGVGQYVHGVSTSAIFDSGMLSTLEGYGAYLGYKQQWILANRSEIGTNVAYGYAMMETPSFLDSRTNRELHQAWANVLYFPNKYVAIGLEYQYGERETLSAGNGENHRFMLVVALTNAPPKPTESTFLSRDSAPTALTADGVPIIDDSANEASRQAL